MGMWTDVVGTVRGYIRLGLTGVRLKNSSGSLAVRNTGDSADAALSCAGLTLSDKVTFADSTLLNSSPTGGFKNKIIGGDFTTNPWQRGTSFTAPASGSYTADRFVLYKTTSAVVNILKTADAPTADEVGMFTQHCLHADVTTSASMGASDFYMVGQYIEGYNAATFGFGQSGTRYVTLSFWVKSTKTGTFCVCATNSAWNRSYIAEYIISTTNTWEKKVVTLAVDTSGTWLYDSGIGLRLYWVLACGSTYQTTAGSWQAGTYFCTANQVNALDSTSNDFKLALVQLEAGSVATPFETRDRGQEVALCQRYFETSYSIGTAPGTATATGQLTYMNQFSSAASIRCNIPFRTSKRTEPTMTYYNPTTGGSGTWRDGVSDRTTSDVNTPSTEMACVEAASVATGSLAHGHYVASAEL